MSLLRDDFRRRPRRDKIEIQIIDDDFGAVLRAPFLCEGAVEPLVIGGDKVRPMQNL